MFSQHGSPWQWPVIPAVSNSFRTSLGTPPWRRQLSQAAPSPQRSGCQLCVVLPSSFWVLILLNSSFCCPCPRGGSCSLQSHLCVTSGWTLLHFQFSSTWLAIPYVKFSLVKYLVYFSFLTGPWRIQDQHRAGFIPFTLLLHVTVNFSSASQLVVGGPWRAARLAQHLLRI